MDPAWRFKSMREKGADAVSGSELAVAISNAESDRVAAEGLSMLEAKWGRAELASMLAAEVPSKPLGMKRPGSTVLAAVVAEVAILDGRAADGWARLGMMLDFGADPDAAAPGGASALESALNEVDWAAGGSSAGAMLEAAAMMLARSAMPSQPGWAAKAALDHPACARAIEREWAKREARCIDAAVGPAARSERDAPRL